MIATVGKSPLVLAMSLALGSAGTVSAQGLEDWSWQVTPYVWATGIGGEITPFTGAPTVEFETTFAEVLEDLDFAFFVSAFGRKDRFVVFGDISYSASSREGTVPPPVGPAPISGEMTQTSLTFAAGYRVVDEPGVSVDLMAGARLWRINASVEVPPGGGVISVSPEINFSDPIIAARANFQIAPQWSALLYGDFGGFGVGSDQTSQFVATVNYQLRDNLYLSAGYRVLNVDYDDGSTQFDATMSGPLVGATWRF